MANCHLTNRTAFQRSSMRFGLTLIEIMIALTMTLIVLGAMMQAFQFASIEMSKGRAMIGLSNQMRVAEETFRRDLSNMTVEPRVYTENEVPLGYFEIVEGPRQDFTGLLDDATPANLDASRQVEYGFLGDFDDYVGMTVRNSDSEYRGRLVVSGVMTAVESSVAEIVYWTSSSNRSNNTATRNPIEFDEGVTLFRRVLLIRPDLGTILTGQNADQVNYFFQQNDISARVIDAGGGTYDIVANSLSDLANRGSRFCHSDTDLDNDGVADVMSTFPHALQRSLLITRRALYDIDGDLVPDQPTGDDILISDIAAFDIKIFSPRVTVTMQSGLMLGPDDFGFDLGATEANNTDAEVSYLSGAFTDLGTTARPERSLSFSNWITNGWFTPGWFTAAPNPESQLDNIVYASGFAGQLDFTWDSWTPEYEFDSYDQDGDTIYNQATNGIDDDGVNGVDDIGERETRPPYADPIRGIKATIRLIEKNSKQVRQSSIIHSFVPQ